MKKIRKRLTYANVMSSIAVFLVIGGATAFAALGKNTVGSKQLKKNAVTAAKVKKNAVTTPKIKNGAVTAPKLAAGAIGTGSLANGSVTNEKLADGAVTGNKIAGNTISTGNTNFGAFVPRAYGWVEDDGTSSPGFSLGLPSASNPEEGEYCFDLPFAPKHAQATVAGDSEPNDLASVIVAGTASFIACPPGTDLEVQTWDTEENELENEDFYVIVW